MNRREKVLVAAVGAFVVLLVVYLAVDNLLLAKADELDARFQKLTQDIGRKQRQKEYYSRKSTRLKKLAARTFGSKENYASEQVRARLVRLLQRSALDGRGMSLEPASGRKVKDCYREIGWLVRAQGKLSDVVSFLYLLNSEPYLHRVENLSLSPLQRTGQVDVNLRYTTLILISEKGEEFPSGRFPDPDATGDLDGRQRKQYDVIAARDLFRPYLQHVAARQPPKPQPVVKPEPSAPPGRRLRVVSLTDWAGRQEIHLRDTESGEMKTVNPGEQLAGGQVVMIDYRMMPMPQKKEILSGSRVIIRIGREYWAVELGQSLAEKHRLATAELPKELKASAR